MEQYFLSHLKYCKDYDDVYDLRWKYFLNKRVDRSKVQKLKICIITLACNGFGDYVFAMKIYNYLKDWYNFNIDIITTGKNKFEQLFSDTSHIIELQRNKNSNENCRKLNKLKLPKSHKKIYDLLLVCPLSTDFQPKISDVTSVFSYANKFNTIFFSEYNDENNDVEDFDFPTGIGDDRYGLLLTDCKKSKKINILKNLYSLIYIANTDEPEYCYNNFIKLITKKYIYKEFDIIVPLWILKELIKNYNKRYILNYGIINFITKEYKKTINLDRKSVV